MQKWPNILLVAGTNRNVGKTTFICKIIEAVAKVHEVTALKITPHFHELTDTLELIHESDNLVICKELSKKLPKDSSKMLAAGAKHVFYVQCTDEKLPEAFKILELFLPSSGPIVCESAALGNLIEPGLFVVMRHANDQANNKNSELLHKANINIVDYKYKIKAFEFNKNTWQINH